MILSLTISTICTKLDKNHLFILIIFSYSRIFIGHVFIQYNLANFQCNSFIGQVACLFFMKIGMKVFRMTFKVSYPVFEAILYSTAPTKFLYCIFCISFNAIFYIVPHTTELPQGALPGCVVMHHNIIFSA